MNYNLILARYGEIGVKSPKIRVHFEKDLLKILKQHLIVKLKEIKVEYIFIQKTLMKD